VLLLAPHGTSTTIQPAAAVLLLLLLPRARAVLHVIVAADGIHQVDGLQGSSSSRVCIMLVCMHVNVSVCVCVASSSRLDSSMHASMNYMLSNMHDACGASRRHV
jgi:hypothetical protein